MTALNRGVDWQIGIALHRVTVLVLKKKKKEAFLRNEASWNQAQPFNVKAVLNLRIIKL